MVTLKSDKLTVQISEKGAEIQSVTSNNGTEFMWCGDENVWAGRAPILFPICGGLKEDKFIYEGKEYVYLYLDGFRFAYNHGRLEYIEFDYRDRYVSIYEKTGNDDFCEYPHYGENTWMMRLLDPKTTEAAIDEMYARLDGTYKEPVSPSLWYERPLMLVALSAIGGAAVAAVAAWAITYFVMRKRAKNPPRLATCAGIDVPTEDAPLPDGAPDSTPTPPDA